MVKTDGRGNFADRQMGGSQIPFCAFETKPEKILTDRQTGLCFGNTAEIAVINIQCFGNVRGGEGNIHVLMDISLHILPMALRLRQRQRIRLTGRNHSQKTNSGLRGQMIQAVHLIFRSLANSVDLPEETADICFDNGHVVLKQRIFQKLRDHIAVQTEEYVFPRRGFIGPVERRSAFDAMAFYQMNRIQIGDSAALVSLGGTFSDRQITGVMERFPNARAFDCFDNDLAGRIYGLRMMALEEDIQMKISRTDSGIRIEAKGKVFEPDMERPLLAQVARQLNIRYRMGQWLPPKAFKDWNDCLLNRPMEPVISPHKEEREQNLSEQRNKGRKI